LKPPVVVALPAGRYKHHCFTTSPTQR